jgi:hypothetical protein
LKLIDQLSRSAPVHYIDPASGKESLSETDIKPAFGLIMGCSDAAGTELSR